MIPDAFDPKQAVRSHLSSFKILDIPIADAMTNTEAYWVTPSGSHRLHSVAQLWRSASEAWDYLPSAWSLACVSPDVIQADVALAHNCRVKPVRANFKFQDREIVAITIHDLRAPVNLNG
jgi:hypothetical protein